MPALQPNIRLTFRGIMVVFISEGRPTCEVGILRQPPDGHVLTIDFTRSTVNGTPQFVRQLTKTELQPQLRLDVQNISAPGIHLFTQSRFDRKTFAGDAEDFRWAVDFKELYEGAIQVDPSGFSSIISINNGKFFTERRSVDELHLQAGSEPVSVFGRVAVGIGAHIYLDREDSRAVFTNGEETLFEFGPEPGVTYGINISQSPPPDIVETPGIEADSNSYHTVITPAPESEKPPVNFLPSTDAPSTTSALPISEHAECFIAASSSGP